MKSEIWVLLHDIEGPINFGAICRAMANTGFNRLRFSGNLSPQHEDARKFAMHAAALLEGATHCADLDQLTGGLDRIFAFSPRDPWPDGTALDMDTFHAELSAMLKEGYQIGLLFGNEAHGLTNRELAQGDFRIALPTQSNYPSMNLAQAVTVVLWEIMRRHEADAVGGSLRVSRRLSQAGAPERAALVTNLRLFLDEMAFLNPQNPEALWLEILPIFRRRDWSKREIELLNAIFAKGASRYRALARRATKEPDR